MTVGELLGFARQRGWGQTRTDAMNKLLQELIVIDINDSVVQNYAIIHDFFLKKGRTVGDNDVWIAATAAATASQLITTDADFDPLAGNLVHVSRFILTLT